MNQEAENGRWVVDTYTDDSVAGPRFVWPDGRGVTLANVDALRDADFADVTDALVGLIRRDEAREELPTMSGIDIREAVAAGKRVECVGSGPAGERGTWLPAPGGFVQSIDGWGYHVVARIVEQQTREVHAREVRTDQRAIVPGGRSEPDTITAVQHVTDMETGALLAVELHGQSIGRWVISPDTLVSVLEDQP